MKHIDKTSLSYWFPKLVEAGLPVPKTKILKMPKEASASIWALFDGEEGGDIKPFAKAIADAAEEFGFPFFLRTDHTSGKHGWDRACFVPDEASIPSHVAEIAEYSELAGFPGLPWETWVVREMLPTIPFGVCVGYGNMPVCREFRFFVEDERIVCRHPYWPLHALEHGGAPPTLDFDELCRIPDEAALSALASAAGRAVGGAWSVDILETRRGWFITDMAEAHKSYHWEGCEAT